MSKINYARIIKENNSPFNTSMFNLSYKLDTDWKCSEHFVRLGDATQFIKEQLDSDKSIRNIIGSIKVTHGTIGIGGHNEDVTKWFLESLLTKALKAQKPSIKERMESI